MERRQTYVAVHVTSDFTGQMIVNLGVNVQVFFDGNMSVKARDIVNETGLAANMQFYSISPTDPNTYSNDHHCVAGNFVGHFVCAERGLSLTGNPTSLVQLLPNRIPVTATRRWHYDRRLDSSA